MNRMFSEWSGEQKLTLTTCSVRRPAILKRHLNSTANRLKESCCLWSLPTLSMVCGDPCMFRPSFELDWQSAASQDSVPIASTLKAGCGISIIETAIGIDRGRERRAGHLKIISDLMSNFEI